MNLDIHIKIFFRKLSHSNKNDTEGDQRHQSTRNQLDTKLIHINAQITAMTTFFEVCGNVVYFLFFTIHFTRNTSIKGVIHTMIVYDIILPYSFLMNTSHKKNRVVDHGWKNVFKNLIRCSNDDFPGTEEPTNKTMRLS